MTEFNQAASPFSSAGRGVGSTAAAAESTANRQRAERVMRRDGLQALVATTPENVGYVIGSQLRATNWTMQIYAVLPADPTARPRLIIPTNRLGVVAQIGLTTADLYLYSDFFLEGSPEGRASTPDVDAFYALLQTAHTYAGPLEALNAALHDLGVGQAAVGIDEMRISPSVYAQFEAGRPERSVIRAYALFREIRQVKTPVEIRRLREAAILNERLERELIGLIREGVHEEEIAAHYRRGIVSAGAVPAMVAVGAGPRSALPLIERYFRRIEQGDLVRFDLCSHLDGYWADTGRTAVLGEADEWQTKHFAAVYAGWETALEQVRPGVQASEIFEAAVGRVRGSGIPHYRRQHVGHAIGLELYDDIVLGPSDHRVLEEGMVFCVEVPYYELGAGGFQIEDTVVVTPDGYEFLTGMPRVLYRQ
ncbi:Xaa-Pro peptidase family protein [Saccharibacillus sacchari]|uniref:Xaa-Pro peptidase family protein n=1 Tax=Saccharibacillus sacchari TaxID=456493 RepID=A0ACC6PH75_9BACL